MLCLIRIMIYIDIATNTRYILIVRNLFKDYVHDELKVPTIIVRRGLHINF
jgi:hypothetical protein